MSLDIDWSLLTSSSDSSSSSLSSTLIATLNGHLASTSRPSFIGPISIAAFEFGSTAPSVEIRDIRDVWRAFDEDDDEDEDYDDEDEDDYDEGEWGRGTRDQSFDSYESHALPRIGAGSQLAIGGPRWNGEIGSEEEYEMLSPIPGEGEDGEDGDMDDNVSVYSGMSPRYSVAALGVGMGFGLGAGTPSARQMGKPGYKARQPSYRPFPHSRSISQSLFSPPPLPPSARPLPSQPTMPSRRRPRPLSMATHQQPIGSPPSSLPPSPPTHPSDSPSSSSGAPSLQLHVHISHASDITLTLLTSLQVNYPSSLFMSLPLRLCVTGLSIEADVVLAYANSSDRDSGPETHGGQRNSKARRRRAGGDKGKVHLCLTDEDPSSAIPVGQRIIPHVQIESEIGDGDVHVLRNVGKVERFIVEALRKTIVDELVFPNFHTVVL